MYPYITSAVEHPWTTGPYEGVELLMLHKNETSGGMTILRKFAAGMTIPAHTHPETNESVYILSGEWEEECVSYTTGTFFYVPRGQRHGPHKANTEVISLTIFDGPLTFV